MHYIMGKKTGGKYNKIYSECFWMAKTMAYMFYSNKQDKIYLYFPNILNNLKLHKRWLLFQETNNIYSKKMFTVYENSILFLGTGTLAVRHLIMWTFRLVGLQFWLPGICADWLVTEYHPVFLFEVRKCFVSLHLLLKKHLFGGDMVETCYCKIKTDKKREAKWGRPRSFGSFGTHRKGSISY